MKRFEDLEEITEMEGGPPWAKIAIVSILILLPVAKLWDRQMSRQRVDEFQARTKAREMDPAQWLEENFPEHDVVSERLGELTILTFFGVEGPAGWYRIEERLREMEGVEAQTPLRVDFRSTRQDWRDRYGREARRNEWIHIPVEHRVTILAETAE